MYETGRIRHTRWNERVNVIWFENIKAFEFKTRDGEAHTAYTHTPTQRERRARWTHTTHLSAADGEIWSHTDGRNLICNFMSFFSSSFSLVSISRWVAFLRHAHSNACELITYSRLCLCVCVCPCIAMDKYWMERSENLKIGHVWMTAKERALSALYGVWFVCACVCVFSVRCSYYRPSIYLPNIIIAFPCIQKCGAYRYGGYTCHCLCIYLYRHRPEWAQQLQQTWIIVLHAPLYCVHFINFQSNSAESI